MKKTSNCLIQSEIQTAILTKMAFFAKHVHTNVKFKIQSNEYELCDVLIEFEHFYICVQVKEKSVHGESRNDKWFQNKVLHRAVTQSKNCAKYISLDNLVFYTILVSGDIKTINIDKDKSILYVIVFHNCEYPQYTRYYYSASLGKHINIFSLEDFKTLVNSAVIPIDIVQYLVVRPNYVSLRGESRLFWGECKQDYLLFGRLETEEDCIGVYILSNYYQKGYHPEYVEFYRELLQQLEPLFTNEDDDMFSFLLSADTSQANEFVKHYTTMMNNIKSSEYDNYFALYRDKAGFIYLRKPYNVNEQEFENVIRNLVYYFSYKHKFSKIYLVVMKYEIDNNCSFNFGTVHCNPPDFDPEYEKLVKEMEKNSQNNET